MSKPTNRNLQARLDEINIQTAVEQAELLRQVKAIKQNFYQRKAAGA